MNELAIADSIDKELQRPRKESVFPLTPTHRKELRQLRDKNIGNLRQRLNNIRRLKKEEYKKKYQHELTKELDASLVITGMLNKDWQQVLEKVNDIIDKRKNLEKKYDAVNNFNLNNDYSDFSRLNKIMSSRNFYLDSEQKSSQILDKEFDEQYSEPFNLVGKKIDRIEQQYEEAINFGDLEIVKKLYYTMKNADILFIKIDRLKI